MPEREPRRKTRARQAALRLFRLGILIIGVVASAAATADTVMLPMGDGVSLATDFYVPAGSGPMPVVLMRTVYGRDGGASFAKRFNGAGLALVLQDTRGTGGSEGKAEPYLSDGWGERQDGAETVAWIRSQPWCNGTIGTLGTSALGITQNLLSGTGVQLSAQSVTMAPSRFYGQLAYQGGVLHKILVETWSRSQGGDEILNLFKSHPARDAFWAQFDVPSRVESVTSPGLYIGGWFDIFGKGTVEQFQTRQHQGGEGARGNQKLVMGPWTHGSSQTVGELTLADNWNFEFEAAEDRFLTHWLKGDANGIADEPAVTYYTLGACGEAGAPGNEWRTASDWPPHGHTVAYQLGADGALTPDAPAAGARLEYTFDPADPCPTLGGANAHIKKGPYDQRALGNRTDMLTFMTPPLAEAVEATGPVTARLYASTDAPDTDFTAKLLDIYPDGRQMLLLDNIRRLKFHNGFETPEPVMPGEVALVEIDLWNISIIFNARHRIGLQISSSNTPRYEVNPNTGEDFPTYAKDGTTGEARLDPASVRKARNTIHLGGSTPSALILSVPETSLK